MVRLPLRPPSRFVRWTARALRTRPKNIERWERLILTSFLVTLAVYGARSLDLLEGLETSWLDLMADMDRPRFDSPIAVVAITDDDYHDPALFGGLSPLDPDALRRLIRQVVAHRPRGVILDVQIHPAAHEPAARARARLRLYQSLDSLGRSSGPRVVLVRDREAEAIESAAADSMRAAWDELTSSGHLHWGDPALERWHGVVRAVPRQSIPHDRAEPVRPTLLGAAISAFELHPKEPARWWLAEEKHPSSMWRIRFTGLFVEDTTAIMPYRTNGKALVSAPLLPGQHSLLADRIVLIGGTYHAGRDVHPTPVGRMAGVYVWAEALASWIRHDALREPHESIAFALEFLVGVIAGLLLVRSGPALGLFYSLLVVGPLTIVCSLLTFGDRILFVSFLPSVVGVYLHYQVELHIEIKHLKRELREALGRPPEAPASPTPPPSSPTPTPPAEG